MTGLDNQVLSNLTKLKVIIGKLDFTKFKFCASKPTINNKKGNLTKKTLVNRVAIYDI